MDLAKRLSSSNTIKSFLNFLSTEIYSSEVEVLFITFKQDTYINDVPVLNSVFWKFQENLYISLSGTIIKRSKDKEFQVLNTILEANSSKNLLKLFTCETMSVKNDPLKDLIESMVRLAQVNVENHREIVNCEVYFQNSVLIGGKREYPLYILNQNCKITEDFIMELARTEAKVDFIQSFYKNNSNLEGEEVESILFSNEKIYEILFDASNLENFEKMVQFLKKEDLKLTDLTDSIEEFPINFEVLEEKYEEILESKEPFKKLKKLKEFQSKITVEKEEINADLLLPLLTYVLIKLERGHLILCEIEFIERYAHDTSLNGLNGYILTTLNAAVEVIKSIYESKTQAVAVPNPKTEEVNVPPSSPSHFSNLISSIGQMPKVIASSITSTLSRTRLTNTAQTELEAFRERMLGTNSANDLLIRDINPLLEDYKNLLYILFKQ